jgi:hypothetical protein
VGLDAPRRTGRICGSCGGFHRVRTWSRNVRPRQSSLPGITASFTGFSHHPHCPTFSTKNELPPAPRIARPDCDPSTFPRGSGEG